MNIILLTIVSILFVLLLSFLPTLLLFRYADITVSPIGGRRLGSIKNFRWTAG